MNRFAKVCASRDAWHWRELVVASSKPGAWLSAFAQSFHHSPEKEFWNSSKEIRPSDSPVPTSASSLTIFSSWKPSAIIYIDQCYPYLHTYILWCHYILTYKSVNHWARAAIPYGIPRSSYSHASRPRSSTNALMGHLSFHIGIKMFVPWSFSAYNRLILSWFSSVKALLNSSKEIRPSLLSLSTSAISFSISSSLMDGGRIFRKFSCRGKSDSENSMNSQEQR